MLQFCSQCKESLFRRGWVNALRNFVQQSYGLRSQASCIIDGKCKHSWSVTLTFVRGGRAERPARLMLATPLLALARGCNCRNDNIDVQMTMRSAGLHIHNASWAEFGSRMWSFRLHATAPGLANKIRDPLTDPVVPSDASATYTTESFM